MWDVTGSSLGRNRNESVQLLLIENRKLVRPRPKEKDLGATCLPSIGIMANLIWLLELFEIFYIWAPGTLDL
jgi:hypothetical protein